jgi:small subunit ribosomal protein S8e
VKNAIIQIDATPFKQWYLQHYGIDLSLKKHEEAVKPEAVVDAKVRGGGCDLLMLCKY